ncbi:MAG: glutamate racemase [Clostridia bacterium]|nr:glutamate racemase [Clostridia bacterium]
MNDNRKIGIFDSGIGGVTVLKEIVKVLQSEDYIYYSDSKNNPYGDKSDNEIMNICDNIVKFFIKNDCKAIVIACNTASTKVADRLREKYLNIQFVAIEPAYKMVYDYAYEKSTLIMATKGTIESEKFNILYNKFNNYKTYLLECVRLADIIESGEKKKIKEYLNDNIGKYKKKVQNVVLGCTHYPLIQNEIKDTLGNVTFFNGSYRLAIHLKEILEKNKMIGKNEGKIEFIDSQRLKRKEERFYKILENR